MKLFFKLLFLLNVSYFSCTGKVVPAIVIDSGATNIRVGFWDGLELKDVKRVKTPNYKMPDVKGFSIEQLQAVWVATLKELVDDYVKKYPQVECVSIGFPGPVDKDGTIIRSANLWGADVRHMPKKELEDAFLLPVYIADDLTTSLFRYVSSSDYQEYDRIALLTVSSGIAVKLYDRYSNRVVLDKKGRGGSICYTKVDDSEDPIPDPILPGNLNSYASGCGIIKLARKLVKTEPFSKDFDKSILKQKIEKSNQQLETIDSELFNQFLISCFKQSDQFSVSLLRTSIEYLAKILCIYIISAAPDVIILMGGFAEAFGEVYRNMLVHACQKRKVFGYADEEIDRMIKFGICDDLNGLIGAGKRCQIV